MGINAKNSNRLKKKKNPPSRRAVFLDRDGTLIKYFGVPEKPEQIQPFKSTAAALKIFNRLGFRTIIITNQPIIEKGIITRKQGDALNVLLQKKMKEKGARLDAAFICPHKYGSNCSCRKPDLGLIKQAQKKFKIDLKKSFVIGDSTRDVMTGKNAKMRTILVKTGEGGKDRRFFDVDADYAVRDILAAAKLVEKLEARSQKSGK